VRLVVLVFAICALACLLGHAAILLSLIRSRSARVGAGMPRPRLVIEIMWALVPVLALTFLLTATWDRVRENAMPKPKVMMKVAQ
jgi:apolipoprotein N-acyltransferase